MGQEQPTGDARAKSPRGAATAAGRHVQALGRYEQAVAALQHREFETAAALFGQVIDDFPAERQLHERSRRYLSVCRRESQEAFTPETLDERVYAATLALNAGRHDDALRHLDAAQRQSPDSDRVQYMLALARADRGDLQTAGAHLLRSIELNPENRHVARREPSLELLREDEAIQEALRAPSADRSRRGAGSHPSR